MLKSVGPRMKSLLLKLDEDAVKIFHPSIKNPSGGARWFFDSETGFTFTPTSLEAYRLTADIVLHNIVATCYRYGLSTSRRLASEDLMKSYNFGHIKEVDAPI